MLYVLPPPRAPNPPSPWESILCTNGNGADRTPWGDVKQTSRRPPFKVKSQKLRSKNDDSSCAAAPDDDETARSNKSLSECYFAGKGTALVLPPHERLRPSRRCSAAGSDIQQHLQSMFYLLRQEETLKMAVKLESVHAGRTRYLVVVSCLGRQNAEESCLLGIDCNERTTVGLVLRVLADTTITLDGDGGFSVSVCGRHHIFKPVSVQAMWSALQTLHKVSSKAREQNYFQGGPTHDWVQYYEQHIESDRSCLNEWHAMDSLESRRPPSPDSVRTKPRERDETEKVIRSTLKEIMMSVDLDEVTSKYIRSRLEEDLDMDLGEFKSFIDQEMLTILGQMDAPTEIFDHVYLGSEWNASNFEELQKNGVGHILNVTREIDNFFPGMFDYLNIRVYDDEKTDLLKYWDNTFKYITKAKKEGSKVLVHCKMGVSRSASVVIAYAMKAYDWDFQKALKHVKEKRSCIKPNTSFIAQLETYQGILDAMKNKEKLQRSKSDTNLKSPELVNKSEKRVLTSNESSSTSSTMKRFFHNTLSGHDLRTIGLRPKSWSPDIRLTNNILMDRGSAPVFLSLENLSKDSSHDSLSVNAQTSPEVRRKSNSCPLENARNVLMMPFQNGQSYSVSPNKIVHICKKRSECLKPLVKIRINELESQSTGSTSKKQSKEKKNLVLNLTNNFKNGKSKSISPPATKMIMDCEDNLTDSSTKLVPTILTAKLVKKEIWDPGESKQIVVYDTNNPSLVNCDSQKVANIKDNVVWTSSTVVKQSVPLINNVDKSVENSKSEVFCNKTVLGVIGNNSNKVLLRKEGDVFSSQVDKVFDREERKQQRHSVIVTTTVTPPQQTNITEMANEDTVRECPSRQSSWSSYDSAVVLGYQGETREAPSRHSSWGSGDTRALPSRNSSWGSYDMKPGQIGHGVNEKGEKTQQSNPELLQSSSGLFSYDREEIPGYPGTVKRTKQKLEGSKDTFKRFHDVKNIETVENLGTNNVPQKSPSTETLTSDYSVSVLSENEAIVEAFNPVLIHCESSSDPCNQRIITSVVDQQPFLSSKAISKEIDIISDSDKYSNSRLTSGSRLSVSAPENSSLNLMPSKCVSLSSRSDSNVSNMEKRTDIRNSKSACETIHCNAMHSFVQKHKNYLENLQNKSESAAKRNSFADAALNDTESNSCVTGIVKNLKKEFEAKTNVIVSVDNNPEQDRLKGKGGSLPSSPVSSECKLSSADRNSTPIEDISVKELVGKYEVVGFNRIGNNKSPSSQENSIRSRCSYDNKLFSNNQHKNMRYSCIEVLPNPSDKLPPPMLISTTNLFQRDESKRPSMSSASPLPSVVMATVVKAASKKQKHLKKDTHNCLNLKPRNNNPVYNTM